MLDTIPPGSKINLTIVKDPTNAAARKTLVRLLSKDPASKAEERRQKRVRRDNFRQNRRGGRFWDVHMVKQHMILGKPGEKGTITATLDVLTDLKSVVKFIEVAPAKA